LIRTLSVVENEKEAIGAELFENGGIVKDGGWRRWVG